MKAKELKQKISECFANDKIKEKPAYIRNLIDEACNKHESIVLSEKQKAIECIKALSRIEGYTMSSEGLKRTPMLYDNITYIMEYFEALLEDLER